MPVLVPVHVHATRSLPDGSYRKQQTELRNSRERWRTIRSSFLRSLKAARTTTGRGKRKYYLSKYLQFLIPYTKSRACHKQLLPAPIQANANASTNATPQTNASTNHAGGMVLRKPSTSTTAATFLAAAALSTQPMTRIGHMRLLEHHHQHHHHHHHQEQHNEGEDNTKDSIDSQPAHVQLSEEELDQEEQEDEPEQETDASQLAQTPLRLQAIKVEQQQQQQSADKIVAAAAQHSLVTLPVTMAAALRNNMDWTVADNNMLTHLGHAATTPPAASTPAPTAPPATAAAAAATPAAAQPDADYSFLISLHPYLKEMSGKQNRRFRQKVVGLIDNVLDNVDV
ncbi:uncharacterized protein Dvir_GJ26580 [Drosophila virilis]|uniref:BESS domain-containing protein n=1 Tax=Drosophila virilis TaxID=7244 RepID=A0A0Q9W775_DROVI|nr:uncharacterized protein Dvir_GJ26580 [Drosophila virilis]